MANETSWPLLRAGRYAAKWVAPRQGSAEVSVSRRIPPRIFPNLGSVTTFPLANSR